MNPIPMVYRNITNATVSGFSDVLRYGVPIRVRNMEIKEIRNRITVLQYPRQRCLFLPGRRNNIFASIAETMWVVAGRNDVEWLQTYLPRARDFSDDGVVWRAGYGPRLRNWNGIDQLKEIRRLLQGELASRRAVASLYDPERDFVDSKDVPCNNWLHWLVRDNRLHLNVAVRSNDAVWGFSGVNAFEWSVLQEMVAHWIGVEVGEITFLASSFHIYSTHYSTAKEVVERFNGSVCYDYGLDPLSFSTRWEDFDQSLKVWFILEEEIRRNPSAKCDFDSHLNDPFLKGALEMIRLYLGVKSGWSLNRLRDELGRMSPCDFSTAAYEHFGRESPELLQSIPHPSIREFFSAYHQSPIPTTVSGNWNSIVPLVKRLHRTKDAAYGSSWKKRGELISILANIARKVDRLAQFNATSTTNVHESIFDTAVDLLVYLTKYRLYLMEHLPTQRHGMPVQTPPPFSDHVENFNILLDRIDPPATRDDSLAEVIGLIVSRFESLQEMAEGGRSDPDSRLSEAEILTDLSVRLIVFLTRFRPDLLDTFSSEISAIRDTTLHPS